MEDFNEVCENCKFWHPHSKNKGECLYAFLAKDTHLETGNDFACLEGFEFQTKQ